MVFVGGEMVLTLFLFPFVGGEMVLTENNKYVDAVVSFVGGEMAFKGFL